MILELQYRGKPLVLDVQEHKEKFDCIGAIGDPSRVSVICCLDGKILSHPKGLLPGQRFRVRSQGLEAVFLVRTKRGHIVSDGAYRLLPEMAADS